MKQIQLDVEKLDNDSQLGLTIYNLRFVLSAAVGLDTSKLFVVVKSPTASDADRVNFCTVATAADLENLLEDAPPVESPGDPYRVDAITLTTDHIRWATQLEADIKRNLKALLDELTAIEGSGDTATYVISAS